MSFNWFNRPQNPPSSDANSDTQPSEQPSTSTDISTEAAGTTEGAIDSNYLEWAKAAYKNIQKKQAEAATSTPSEPTTTEAAPDLPEASPADLPVTADSPMVETEETPETAIASEVVAPDLEPATSTPPEATEEQSPTASPETNAAEQSALPFWMKAEAERQERLERLKAEAIVEPEPETRQTAPTTSDAVPELPLDENFVWSAQVLAAQGRRPDQVDIEEITWLKRLRQGLDKTRRSLVNQLRAIVGQGPLNQDAVIEIESLLLQADVGVEATDFIIESLQNRLRQEALPPEQAIAYLKEILRGMLDTPGGKPYNPTFAPEKETLNIWLITGVNGAGKTTTIGKLAHIAQKSGYRCLIGAADTFRAAAVQQVKVWGDRSNVEVIANPGKNTDPAAVVFDAITAAQARDTELLLIDTAGRLQNKKNLMDELSKIRRIIDKKAPNAHIESLLVLDATLGQNGLRQAEVFSEAAQLSGVVLTKLDGTAKGGIALAVVQQLGLPIRFIGVGEGIEDLRPFSSYEFVEALLSG
ncbi:signal recognition particle-docking protein FtsY [Oscillatoria sp. FACHB-1407]|uniref:signal recognition particle-docking protein FtsY n=1 Tax=Oscillatoria sp. FACHB-1407 TaxID=2692847 RepID=UPI0016863807|nr:signal recognition particle-docking protein FtsY [Oscillatoria sp. FACHB-1407]MBD2461073.1 signal recognition particle-docking protein FtsY [Oscillatoria sp. FACHB-1407]